VQEAVIGRHPLPLSNSTHIGICDHSGERIVAVQDLTGQLQVDGLIRLSEKDFAQLPVEMGSFVHFNLEFTLNEMGRRYAIVPLIRAGRRLDDGQEVLPIIDPSRSHSGLCTEIVQHLPTGDVSEAYFAFSLPTIRTHAALRAALSERYGRMFPNLSDDALMARGCAITRIVFDQS
jgi:hypothetical protein